MYDVKLIIWCKKAREFSKVTYKGPKGKGNKKIKTPISTSEQGRHIPLRTPYTHLPSLPCTTLVTNQKTYTLEQGERWVFYKEKYVLLSPSHKKIYSIKKEDVVVMS